MIFLSFVYSKCSLFLIFPTNSISAFTKSSSHWPCSKWDDTACNPPCWPLQKPKPALLSWLGAEEQICLVRFLPWWIPCLWGCLAPEHCWPLLSLDTTLLGDSTRISGRDFAAMALDENFIISFYSFHYLLLKLLLGLHITAFTSTLSEFISLFIFFISLQHFKKYFLVSSTIVSFPK